MDIKNIIEEIIIIMNKKYGLDISMYDISFVEKSLVNRIISLDFKTSETYLIYLSENRVEAFDFFGSLSITYSEFFRNQLSFSVLEHLVLPKLIEEKSNCGEIRIWSAGCAGGQEAYSIAMILNKLSSCRANTVRFRIIATDISQSALAFARNGSYKSEAMANVTLEQINKYFKFDGENYEVIPKIKEDVDFSTYNLLDKVNINPPESIFGNFDIIFCSNLLFYYQLTPRKFILKKLFSSLSNKGYFVTSESEKGYVSKINGFYMVTPPVPVFKKSSGGVLWN